MKRQFEKFENKCDKILSNSLKDDKGNISTFRSCVMIILLIVCLPLLLAYEILKFILCFIRLSDPTENAAEEVGIIVIEEE